VVTLEEFFKRVVVSKACPREGVLSLPLLLCLVDDLIARFNGGVIYSYILDYANEIGLQAVGKFPNMLLGFKQRALCTVEAWYKVGLSVNPNIIGLDNSQGNRKYLVSLNHKFLGLLYIALCQSSISG
jgi:hypothetical protein